MTEEWRPVPGYDGAYEVSDQGQVRSYLRRGRSTDRRETPVIVKGSATHSGYRVVSLRGRRWSVHELVLTAFVGPRTAPWPETEVRHLDGHKSHNWLENLQWGTKSENADDMVLHGHHPQARKARCARRGHLLVEPNLYGADLRLGVRRCRACYLGSNALTKRHTTDRDAYADAVYARLMPGDDARVMTV